MTQSVQKLPIDDIKNDVIAALTQHQTLLLTAPPGAGKSTRLPLWLLELTLSIKAKNIFITAATFSGKKYCLLLGKSAW